MFVIDKKEILPLPGGYTYHTNKIIGKGGYSLIYKGENRKMGIEVAVKIVDI
jgi:serine/threonine protein kinase